MRSNLFSIQSTIRSIQFVNFSIRLSNADFLLLLELFFFFFVFPPLEVDLPEFFPVDFVVDEVEWEKVFFGLSVPAP